MPRFCFLPCLAPVPLPTQRACYGGEDSATRIPAEHESMEGAEANADAPFGGAVGAQVRGSPASPTCVGDRTVRCSKLVSPIQCAGEAPASDGE